MELRRAEREGKEDEKEGRGGENASSNENEVVGWKSHIFHHARHIFHHAPPPHQLYYYIATPTITEHSDACCDAEKEKDSSVCFTIAIYYVPFVRCFCAPSL